MSGLSVFSGGDKLRQPKPTTPKNQRDVKGSIFLPLVANLEHTHMKSGPQFATQSIVANSKSFKICS
jgi:hypothetical protein